MRENENSKEGDDTIVSRMKKNQITIEHIMPQTLNQKWKDSLGENWEDIHETYLHTFANLTLTGYNSSYGNHTFTEKKEGYTISKDGSEMQVYGFKDSAFRLSNYLKTCNQWTETELIERQNILKNKFLSMWPMITTNYTPLAKETDTVSFNDDELELTGRKIAAFTYKGTRYQVWTWVDMLIQLCRIIYAEEPIQMNSIAAKEEWFHTSSRNDRSQITENCYVHTSCSTRTKCSILTYLFEQLDLNPADLEFELVPLSDKEVNDNEE